MHGKTAHSSLTPQTSRRSPAKGWPPGRAGKAQPRTSECERLGRPGPHGSGLPHRVVDGGTLCVPVCGHARDRRAPPGPPRARAAHLRLWGGGDTSAIPRFPRRAEPPPPPRQEERRPQRRPFVAHLILSHTFCCICQDWPTTDRNLFHPLALGSRRAALPLTAQPPWLSGSAFHAFTEKGCPPLASILRALLHFSSSQSCAPL